MPNPLELTVNGKRHEIQSASDTPLLYVLRNELLLNGPQYGCGVEQCGACMVLVGSQARLSCRLPVSDIGTSAVTTLEGLSEAGDPPNGTVLHPVQRAFIETQAVQCGYCVNGMIMSTVGLLWRNPHPNDEQIRAALDANLCRCGSHLRILRAVRRAVALLAELEA